MSRLRAGGIGKCSFVVGITTCTSEHPAIAFQFRLSRLLFFLRQICLGAGVLNYRRAFDAFRTVLPVWPAWILFYHEFQCGYILYRVTVVWSRCFESRSGIASPSTESGVLADLFCFKKCVSNVHITVLGRPKSEHRYLYLATWYSQTEAILKPVLVNGANAIWQGQQDCQVTCICNTLQALSSLKLLLDRWAHRSHSVHWLWAGPPSGPASCL